MRKASSTSRQKYPDNPRGFRKGKIRLDTDPDRIGWGYLPAPNEFAEPEGVVGHERAHAIQNIVGEHIPIEVENAAVLKKLFPQSDAVEQLPNPDGGVSHQERGQRVAAGTQKAHHQSRAEQAASTIQSRRDRWLNSLKRGGNWKEFTADDIKKYKRTPLHRATPADSDLINAIQKELDPSLSNQEAADLLNQIVKNQPKAKRGEPTQAIAESKKRKYKVRIKKR